MLNFGPLGVPFAFIPFGFLVGWVRRRIIVWEWPDARLLLLPMLITFGLFFLFGDSDNLSIFLVKQGLVPVAVIWVSSRRKSVSIDNLLPAAAEIQPDES